MSGNNKLMEILNDVDDIKNKLTDNEYKKLMDKLMEANQQMTELKNELNLLVKIRTNIFVDIN